MTSIESRNERSCSVLLWTYGSLLLASAVITRRLCSSPINGHRDEVLRVEGSLRLALAVAGVARGLRCWRLASVALCCAEAQQCTDALRWTCITVATMLMVAATVDKSILVPFVALQAPSGVTFLVKEDHGRLMWIGFLSILVRFLYIITGEWRRAILTAFLVGIAMVPSQVMNLRESQGRAILSSAIAVYLAFQHFTGAGSLRKAFGSVAAIFATLCIVCMTTISLMLVF